MAFRVVRLRREARRNAKLEEIFQVKNIWFGISEEKLLVWYFRDSKHKIKLKNLTVFISKLRNTFLKIR